MARRRLSMLRKFPRKFKVTLACTLLALAGVAVGAWTYQARNTAMRLELLEDARLSAVAFDAAELSALDAKPEDISNPIYSAVKDRLRRLKTADPRVRHVYIIRSLAGS